MSGGAQQNANDETTEFNSNPSSVHSYAYAEDRNMRFRPHMEDTHCIVDKMGGDNSCGLFAIYDGHGGKRVSDHCADRFPIELRKELQKNPQDLCKPIIDIFSKVRNSRFKLTFVCIYRLTMNLDFLMRKVAARQRAWQSSVVKVPIMFYTAQISVIRA